MRKIEAVKSKVQTDIVVSIWHEGDRIMTRQEKYGYIRGNHYAAPMVSVGQFTSGHLPTKKEFFKALSEGRVSGTYGWRITIVSNDPFKSYKLIDNYSATVMGLETA